MEVKLTRVVILLSVCALLCGCSHQILGPEEPTWQLVPCEYRLEGDDESTLLVRTEAADFDSAKIVLHTLSWTLSGDTYKNQITLYPIEHTTSAGYAIFTTVRPLPINTVLSSVELFVKKQARIPRHRYRT